MSARSSKAPSARELIEVLGLEPHFEGGWFREVYRSAAEVAAPRGRRTALTTIYYLLEAGQRSRWHVVSSDEVWHFYAGEPLELLAYAPGTGTSDTGVLTRHVLGTPAMAAKPVAVIPAGVWQAAQPLGEYTLVGCTVAPGFELMDFKFVADLPDHRRHFRGPMGEWVQLL